MEVYVTRTCFPDDKHVLGTIGLVVEHRFRSIPGRCLPDQGTLIPNITGLYTGRGDLISTSIPNCLLNLKPNQTSNPSGKHVRVNMKTGNNAP